MDECLALAQRLDIAEPAAGLLICDQVLERGAGKRLRAVALRYRAIFLLESNPSWAYEAVRHLQEALPLTQGYPADRAHVLHLLISACSLFSSVEYAQPYADEYLHLASETQDPEVTKWMPRIWFNLGYCYAGAREWGAAENAYGQAIASAGDDRRWFDPALAAFNLVRVLMEQGRISDAQRQLNATKSQLAVQYRCHALEEEARLLLIQGERASAQTLCREILEDPACPATVRADALSTLARIAHADGRLSEADAHFAAAMDIAVRIPSSRLVSAITRLQLLHSREEGP